MKEPPRRYASAAAFRVALETRLKAISKAEGIDLQRLRRQVSFDRLLARLFAEKNAPWLLKGGYAMELRLRTARTTKDIDISLPAQVIDVFDVVKLVQQSARIELADFFTFVIGESQLDLNAAPQGGARFPVVASIAGRVFTKFHLDVGIGDAVVQPTELIKGRNWLDFAGIPPAMLTAISKEQQFAEKLHAYTLPRHDSSNSRVKDLVDMVLLARLRTMDKSLLQQAISATFSLRGTHPVPADLPEPPAFWTAPFLLLARECQLELTLSDALQILTEYVSI
jgi:predicted nucleotidyltransferase component of viral defense system